MRTYYIFKINKYFAYVYKKFAIEFNKLAINEYIYKINKTNKNYHRDNNIHILNNDKYNKLTVNSTCIILKTNDIYSVFLNDLNSYLDNVFICDFKNKDYFWLETVNKDGQNNFSLV